jgi:phosphoglycolate phosphatase-like HAD superfamily hydrolase
MIVNPLYNLEENIANTLIELAYVINAHKGMVAVDRELLVKEFDRELLEHLIDFLHKRSKKHPQMDAAYEIYRSVMKEMLVEADEAFAKDVREYNEMTERELIPKCIKLLDKLKEENE